MASPVDAFGEFGIDARFSDEQVVVRIVGDLDLLTGPTLGALLSALVEQGQVNIVLDVADLAFVDAFGLRTIVATSAAAANRGGAVTIRGAVGLTRRLVELMHVGEVAVGVEVARTAADAASSMVSADVVPADVVPADLVAADLVPADLVPADLVPADLVPAALVWVTSKSSVALVDAALRLVTALAQETVRNADGVSVTLERHGRLMTVAASNDAVLRMDGHQYETGQGPCLAAKADGCWYYIESLAEEIRWPAFVPLALEQGIHSILSSPLMAAEQTLGALNIYSNTVGAFDDRDQEQAALLAERAMDILVSAGADVTDEQLARRLTDGLMARQTIAVAQGVLMSRDRINLSAAAANLRRSARSRDETVLEHATRVIASNDPTAGSDLSGAGLDRG